MADHTAEPDAQPFELPEFVRATIESIARFMGVDHGYCYLEFEIRDGHLRRWFRKEGLAGAKELARLTE